MKLFDTHTHLNVEEFAGREAEMVEAARAMDVHYLSVVGFDQPTIERALALSHEFDGIIATIGWHPTETPTYSPQVEAWLEEQLEDPRVKMYGEIGLDYHWMTAPIDQQKEVFRRQIAIAKNHHLPITIHNRDATADIYQILKEEGLPEKGGIMHSFNGDPEWARKFLDLGMHLSYSGVATFKKTEEVRESAKLTPADRLLIETDAPYLAPVPKRGKRNQPAYVRYVAECLAEVRQESLEDFARQTTQNACRLFNWYPEDE